MQHTAYPEAIAALLVQLKRFLELFARFVAIASLFRDLRGRGQHECDARRIANLPVQLEAAPRRLIGSSNVAAKLGDDPPRVESLGADGQGRILSVTQELRQP